MKRFPFAHALCFRLIPVAVVVVGMGGHLYGQGITLYTSYQSVNEAISTFDRDGGVTVDGNVNSLPYSTATTATDSSVTSTVTPTFTTSSLSASFSQSTPDTLSSSSGEATVFFTGAAGYSISGSMTVSGGTHLSGELSAFLYDETTSVYVYQYDYTEGVQSASGPLTLTLDSSGGPLTGSLNSGDVYEFDAFDANNLYNGHSGTALTGTTTLDLIAVPEPSTWAMMLMGAGMFTGFKYFERKSNGSSQA